MRPPVAVAPPVVEDDLTVRLDAHVRRTAALLPSVRDQLPRIRVWGRLLAHRLGAGHRLLVVGNGGSAALGAHLVAELVGRYRTDRPPFSAHLLGAEPATATALVNDYDPHDLFARQVAAHGRQGDVLLALSTSGRSPNLLTAIDAAETADMVTLAMTGRAPNPVCERCDDSIAVPSPDTAAIQEVQQVVVHLLCEVFDDELGAARCA